MDVVGNTLVTSAQTVKKFNSNFKNFAGNQQFVVIAAAICVGIATKDAIEKILNEVIYPFIRIAGNASIAFLLYKKALDSTQSYKILHTVLEKVGAVIWIFIVWFLIAVMSYILLKKVLTVDLINPQMQFVEDNTKRFIMPGGPMISSENMRLT